MQLMSNVRAHEPVGPCHAFARVLVDAVNRRVPRQAQVTGAMNTKGLAPARLGMHACIGAGCPSFGGQRAAGVTRCTRERSLRNLGL